MKQSKIYKYNTLYIYFFCCVLFVCIGSPLSLVFAQEKKIIQKDSINNKKIELCNYILTLQKSDRIAEIQIDKNKIKDIDRAQIHLKNLENKYKFLNILITNTIKIKNKQIPVTWSYSCQENWYKTDRRTETIKSLEKKGKNIYGIYTKEKLNNIPISFYTINRIHKNKQINRVLSSLFFTRLHRYDFATYFIVPRTSPQEEIIEIYNALQKQLEQRVLSGFFRAPQQIAIPERHYQTRKKVFIGLICFLLILGIWFWLRKKDKKSLFQLGILLWKKAKTLFLQFMKRIIQNQ